MKRLFLILISVVVLGQGPRTPYDYFPERLVDSLPVSWKTLLELVPVKPWFKMNVKMNPFYLRGDFDGDGRMDIAFPLQSLDEYPTDGIFYIFNPEGKATRFICGGGTKLKTKDQAPFDDIYSDGYWNVIPPAKGSRRERIDMGAAESEMHGKITFTGTGCHWEGP